MPVCLPTVTRVLVARIPIHLINMATRMFRTTAGVILMLAVMSTGSNRNMKYVKGEAIEGDELCQLGRVISAGNKHAAKTVEDLQPTPPAVMLVDDKEKGEPRAVFLGLERELLGSGAHREVHSAIAIELHLGLHASETSVTGDCEVLLLETLSNGVFADPFELNRLQQKRAVNYAQIYGDVDLEGSARSSFQSIVELHQRLVPEERNGLEVLYRSEVTMPLHARYPLTSTERHSLVNITIPHVLIYCRGGTNATGRKINSNQELCIYVHIAEPLMKTLQWSIPSGLLAHLSWVARLTTFSAFIGVAAIFTVSKLSTNKHGL